MNRESILDKDIVAYGKFIRGIFGKDIKKIVSQVFGEDDDGKQVESDEVLEMTFDDNDQTWKYVKKLVKDGRMK